MRKIELKLESRSYSILIERDNLTKIPELLTPWNDNQKWVIISQETIVRQFGNSLLGDLIKAGFRAEMITIPTGEDAKNLEQIQILSEKLLDMRCDRSTSLLALGGGVVGDITGFLAATFMRGIRYFQIPTTLLAMVDSSIGGKTGVNLSRGKNTVGSIYQPEAVIIDANLLATLPVRERVSGLAEVLKYGAIQDRDFFLSVGRNVEKILALSDMGLVEQIIARSCALKVRIVEQDEQDHKIRRILNFGHTIGHGIESATGYSVLRHGEAVAYGMKAAGYISMKKGFLNNSEWNVLRDTIDQLPLPPLRDLEVDTVLQIIRNDKKIRAGQLYFIVITRLGEAKVSVDVQNAEIEEALSIL
ncbi:MAG: 3-dehydroquinate synthase [Candidatus Neomarinimicrobiota bacterium]